jgi:selenocysteine lyase/cysteine desulfurase
MLENYFAQFRNNIIGINQEFESPYGLQRILYSDWTASGRLYEPIERIMLDKFAPFVGNTHTETTITGSSMTAAYHYALKYIKKHVGAKESDVIISTNSGMTGVVNKFQRILGLKIHERYADQLKLSYEDKPVVFITHMEHHSNQTSWLETIADVEIINADDSGLPDLESLNNLLIKYKDKKIKIAAVTSCSNVTGLKTPFYQIAEMMHKNGGLCFVDFAACAPYIDINMNPENEFQKLDAIYFSPHKFLGGPGSSGILIFDSRLYKNRVPDNPGGGTVDWTNPWGEHKYIENIEAREDGGTPSFLQTMRVALCIMLKEEMGVINILEREHEIMNIIWDKLEHIPNLHILAGHLKDRLGIFSFYIDDLHYNLGVKLLNDKYGIQVRGGCSCAGTYGHFLLHVDKNRSKSITEKISQGDLSEKPGWIRLSIHPTMTDSEIIFITDAIKSLCKNFPDWSEDYYYDVHKNEFYHKTKEPDIEAVVKTWFELER